jgi:hypothetical protein
VYRLLLAVLLLAAVGLTLSAYTGALEASLYPPGSTSPRSETHGG